MSDTSLAVLLLAHGSTKAPESALPVRRLAARMTTHSLGEPETARQLEVRCAFWKEQPSLLEALAGVEAHDVVAVPMFAAEGWFTSHVLPRELGLTGALTRHPDRRIVLTEPFGTHPAVADVVLALGEEECAEDPAHERTALVVVGHGTPRNPDSAQSVRDHVARLRSRSRQFDLILDAFIDEPPLLSDLGARLDALDQNDPNNPIDRVIVVPCFTSDGPHPREDVPAALGLPARTDESPVTGRLGSRVVTVTPAAGIHPAVEAVVQARIREGIQRLTDAPPIDSTKSAALPAAMGARWVSRARERALAELLAGERLTLGQTVVRRDGDRDEIRHVRDADAARETLHEIGALDALAELSTRRADGGYRAVQTLRDRRGGWRYPIGGSDATRWGHVLAALEILEPAGLALAFGDPLPQRDWRDCAARHTGILSGMREATDADVREIVGRACAPACTRVPTWWGEARSEHVPACPEPCPWIRGEIAATGRAD